MFCNLKVKEKELKLAGFDVNVFWTSKGVIAYKPSILSAENLGPVA